METRYICPEIWRDEEFMKLSDKERNVILFLLTNDKIGLFPLYAISVEEIAFYCSISKPKIIKLLHNLQHFGINFYKNYIFLRESFTRTKYFGPKTAEKMKRLHRNFPKEIRDIVDIEGNIGFSNSIFN